MGPPAGVPQASGPPEPNLKPTTIQKNSETTNITYANTLTNSNPSNAVSVKQSNESIKVRKSVRNGMPAVIFNTKEYYGVLADRCKRIIVGRFLRARPQIEKIRSPFNEIFPLKGSVQIGVYDNFNVFIHFTNDDDFNQVWFKRVVEIHGMQMWMQKWTPDIKPGEDEPIVPVWVLLPGLPIHLHDWFCLKHLTSSLGNPLACDLATKNGTRPSMAKVRVEIDLLKPLPTSIWVGTEDDDSPLKGFEQKLEYENVLRYCRHCKKLGHMMVEYRIANKKKETDEKQVTTKERMNMVSRPVTDTRANQNEKVADTSKNASKAAEGKTVENNGNGKEIEVAIAPENVIKQPEECAKSLIHRTKKKKTRRRSEVKNLLQKKPKVSFKPGTFNKLLRPKNTSKCGENSRSSIRNQGQESNQESNHLKGASSTNTRGHEVDQCKEHVQEVDQPIKGHGKQTDNSTKEKVDNRQTSTSRAQECPAPDLQSETLSEPVERMTNTEALYQKSLKRMVDGWKKEWRKSLAEKERVKNTISKPL